MTYRKRTSADFSGVYRAKDGRFKIRYCVRGKRYPQVTLPRFIETAEQASIERQKMMAAADAGLRLAYVSDARATSKQNRRAGPNGGVYVIQGPSGLYVGSSVDCYQRNQQRVVLGATDWGIVREMPGSMHMERMRVETEVADAWAARGWAIVSRNTSYHLRDAGIKAMRTRV